MTALAVVLVVVLAAFLLAPLCSWLDARGDAKDAAIWADVPRSIR